mmetsp:Transcript_69161/g.127014  ORF Transcript_69161/g.127014 Transcript_69161/m.127014 type:complete len:368 (+) Transcript_69161:3-1106(+)
MQGGRDEGYAHSLGDADRAFKKDFVVGCDRVLRGQSNGFRILLRTLANEYVARHSETVQLHTVEAPAVQSQLPKLQRLPSNWEDLASPTDTSQLQAAPSTSDRTSLSFDQHLSACPALPVQVADGWESFEEKQEKMEIGDEQKAASEQNPCMAGIMAIGRRLGVMAIGRKSFLLLRCVYPCVPICNPNRPASEVGCKVRMRIVEMENDSFAAQYNHPRPPLKLTVWPGETVNEFYSMVEKAVGKPVRRIHSVNPDHPLRCTMRSNQPAIATMGLQHDQLLECHTSVAPCTSSKEATTPDRSFKFAHQSALALAEAYEEDDMRTDKVSKSRAKGIYGNIDVKRALGGAQQQRNRKNYNKQLRASEKFI